MAEKDVYVHWPVRDRCSVPSSAPAALPVLHELLRVHRVVWRIYFQKFARRSPDFERRGELEGDLPRLFYTLPQRRYSGRCRGNNC